QEGSRPGGPGSKDLSTGPSKTGRSGTWKQGLERFPVGLKPGTELGHDRHEQLETRLRLLGHQALEVHAPQLDGGDRSERHGAAEALPLLHERELAERISPLELTQRKLVGSVPHGDAHPTVGDDEQALDEQRRPAGIGPLHRDPGQDLQSSLRETLEEGAAPESVLWRHREDLVPWWGPRSGKARPGGARHPPAQPPASGGTPMTARRA